MSEREPTPLPLTKTHDYLYEYRGYQGCTSSCRIQIFGRPGVVPIVIATELPSNHGTSVTNMAEYLAAEIIAKHFPQRFEEEVPVCWIEHYPPIQAYGRSGKTREYSLVEFASYRPRLVQRFGGPRLSIGEPNWRYLEEQEVERILGQKPE